MYTLCEIECISPTMTSTDHSQLSSHRASSTHSLAVSCRYAMLQPTGKSVSPSLCISHTQRMEVHNA